MGPFSGNRQHHSSLAESGFTSDGGKNVAYATNRTTKPDGVPRKCCLVADIFARTKSCHSRTYVYNTRAGKHVTSVLHIDEKTVGDREGFLTWLKDMFNKPVVAEDRTHEADTSIVTIDRTATTLDRPEITVSKRPANSSGKIDVVNQKLANFNATQSMRKFEDGNIRIEKYNAENDAEKCASAIQQSATHISSQSSKKTLERGTDSDFAWFNPGEINRSERNVMKFAARDDSDVAAHYRRYTNPRHCYRLPPRTKQPLLESCALNRNIGVSKRAIADFAPRNSKPPVGEPNMPEKREKQDRKEKKKPIIRTDGEFADSSENRAEMVAGDNPKGDPGTAFRYEWGVKLVEEPAAEASDNDNLAEKSQRYVTKRFWGVNLKQPKPDVEDAPSPASEDPGRNAEEHRNTFSISKSSDTIANETRSNVFSPLNILTKESDASSLKGTTAEYLSTPSYRANITSPSNKAATSQQEKTDADSSEALRKIMKTSLNELKETVAIDDEYNVPEGTTLDTEITAWKNLAMKSKTVLHKEVYMLPDNVENMDMVSIRPEAPQPKLDVQVVKSSEDTLEDQKVDRSNSGYKAAKSMEMKHFGSPQKPDGYVSGKRLHTASMRIPYAHRHVSNIATLSNNSALVDKIMQMRCSRLTSAFSTNSDSSKEVIKTLNQQNKEETDSKSWNKEGKSNDSNASNLLSIKRPFLSSLKSRTFSSSNKKSPDTDNFAENVIANKETETSLNQSQTASHYKKNIRLSSESAPKDETRFKDEDVQDEIEHYDSRNKDATYIDFDTPSTDSDRIESSNAKLSEEDSKPTKESDKNVNWDSNVEDVENEYIDDGDYVRLPGDRYPYNKENLDKWSRFVYKPIKRETKFDSVSVQRPSPRNANGNAYANITRNSHASALMKTSGSGDGAEAKNAGRSGSGFHVSSRSQRVVSDCLRGDAADGLGLRRWTEAFSRLDVRGEMDEVAARGGDDASSRAYHQ
ncbi:LOW QUALITY PROTEIN: dentin sialophosphoprotein-like [Polyergus mexicanus]|uniref:LOW QUALITY PROTEIN: dentin sialophosphoprotein-like n=1 Tax=Polyergus mexicanus TaxID=615972 RepID=UPI0038B556C8